MTWRVLLRDCKARLTAAARDLNPRRCLPTLYGDGNRDDTLAFDALLNGLPVWDAQERCVLREPCFRRRMLRLTVPIRSPNASVSFDDCLIQFRDRQGGFVAINEQGAVILWLDPLRYTMPSWFFPGGFSVLSASSSDYWPRHRPNLVVSAPCGDDVGQPS